MESDTKEEGHTKTTNNGRKSERGHWNILLDETVVSIFSLVFFLALFPIDTRQS
jgi:hypothetical protein